MVIELQLSFLDEGAGGVRGSRRRRAASVHGLKKNERRFDYEFKPAKNWKRTKMNTKYANLLEPKSDLRYAMGLRFDVDLLVPELGQAVASLDEYIPIYLTRLEDSGIDSTVHSFNLLAPLRGSAHNEIGSR